ncbi:unnamed protein product, partial [marine sediment metagenome]
RRVLFTEAIPMKYRGKKIPGIKNSERLIKMIGCIQDNNYIIHLINLKGINKPLTLKFSNRKWLNIEKIVLEPHKKELKIETQVKHIDLSLSSEDVDKIDTILRIFVRS